MAYRVKLIGISGVGFLAFAGLWAPAVSAADQNGYAARYECRAGNPNCNVDVAALANQPCQQTITTGTSPTNNWSAINWSNDVICIEGGDHTGRGTLTISTSGASGGLKVLRYTRPNDSDDEPWNQSSADQAKLHQLVFNGADRWLVHRLTFPASSDPSAMDRVFLQNGASDLIISRLLVEGAPRGSSSNLYSAISAWGCAPGTADRTTIQNSVIRNNWGVPGTDPVGIAIECGTDVRIVNNEMYDWSSHNIQLGHNAGPTMPGAIIENNDSYVTSALYTNSGQTMVAEDPIELKAGGTAAKPLRVIHNRTWGSRLSDTGRCCIGGTGGIAIAVVPPEGGSLSYIDISNNIVFDSQVGIVWASGISYNTSVVGNIFYDIRRHSSSWNSYAIELIKNSGTEVYLNTVIGASQSWLYTDSGLGNGDVKCNVMIDSGSRAGGTPASSTQVDHNAFYATSPYTINGDNQAVAPAPVTWSANTTYNAGTVLRFGTSAQCTNRDDASCYLYKVTQAGTTLSSPNYCTTLGCKVTDGSAELQAIRAPYVFKRKLRTATNGEEVVIPNARVASSAPEAYACPTTFSSRSGIGINDE